MAKKRQKETGLGVPVKANLDERGEINVTPAFEEVSRQGQAVLPSKDTFFRPSLDIIFKLLFAAPKRKKLLISLVNAILGEEYTITDLSVRNIELPGECVEGRRVFLDILAIDDQKRRIDIEMYSSHLDTVADKNLFYMCRLHSQQDIVYEDKDGKDTFGNALKATIGISILAHQKLFADSPFVSEFLVMERTTHHILSHKFQMFSMELPKLYDDIARLTAEGKPLQPCHWWGKFFHLQSEEEVRALLANTEAPELVKEAIMVFQEVTQDERVRAICNARETAILFEQEEKAVNYQNGHKAGARDKQIQMLSRLFAAKLKSPPDFMQDFLSKYSTEALDSLELSVFSIESIEELQSFLAKQ